MDTTTKKNHADLVAECKSFERVASVENGEHPGTRTVTDLNGEQLADMLASVVEDVTRNTWNAAIDAAVRAVQEARFRDDAESRVRELKMFAAKAQG